MKFKLLSIILILILATGAYAFMATDTGKDQPLTTALHKSNIKIIDIRTEPEWKQTGIVKDSYTLTFFDEKGNYNTDDFLKKLNKIVKPSEPFAIICRTGNRTTTVAKFLRQMGYTKVINLLGGVQQAAANNVEFEKYK